MPNKTWVIFLDLYLPFSVNLQTKKMVLTDLPFERNALIHSRYSAICRPGSAPPLNAEEDVQKSSSKDYAAFLK